MGSDEPDTATTVRVEDGKILAIDGPFAETREQLAGYYVLDCTGFERGHRLGRQNSDLLRRRKGSIEIRQLTEFAGVPESILKPHPVTVNASRD